MARGARRDDEGVEPALGEGVAVGHPCPGHGGRDRRGAGRVDVGDDELVDPLQRGEGAGVEGADPTGAGETDAHVTSFVRTY